MSDDLLAPIPGDKPGNGQQSLDFTTSTANGAEYVPPEGDLLAPGAGERTASTEGELLPGVEGHTAAEHIQAADATAAGVEAEVASNAAEAAAGPVDFVHPNEGDDHLAHLGEEPPEFIEEDYVPGSIPGVQARRPSIMLSPEEREAQVKSILDEERNNPTHSEHLILEFGGLKGFEQRLRGVIKDFTQGDVALAVVARMRRCIHEVVCEKPLLAERESTEDGLDARIQAVSQIGELLRDRIEPLLENLAEAGVETHALRAAMARAVDDESHRLAKKHETLVPATLGLVIFDKLSGAASALKRSLTGEKQELVGDVRRHRNHQLGRTLEDLATLTGEMRDHAGDEEWERTEGAMALSTSRELMDNIGGLVKGVEDQVDMNMVNKGLKSATDNITAAAESASDESFKESLKQMLETVKRAVMALVTAVKKALGHDEPESSRTAAATTP